MATQGSILGSLGNAVGIGSSHSHISTQDAYMNAVSPQVMPQYSNNSHGFNFEEVENGWIIQFRGKKWLVEDLEELGQRVVAILVEYKLEK